jgi:hypothetical protein
MASELKLSSWLWCPAMCLVRDWFPTVDWGCNMMLAGWVTHTLGTARWMCWVRGLMIVRESSGRLFCLSATLSTTNSTWTFLGLNLCLRDENPSLYLVAVELFSHLGDPLSVLFSADWVAWISREDLSYYRGTTVCHITDPPPFYA